MEYAHEDEKKFADYVTEDVGNDGLPCNGTIEIELKGKANLKIYELKLNKSKKDIAFY